MAVEMRFVCSCTIFLALQSTVVTSKDDPVLTGCSYSSSTENLQRPGSLRDRFNELQGTKKGFLRPSWKTSVDKNLQNNALQDGDDNSQDGGWSSPNQRIWGKRGFGSEAEELDRRNIKLCESEKRKWGRNNQKVWGKRDDTFRVDPDRTGQGIIVGGLLNYGSGNELLNVDTNFQPDDYKKLETDSDSWSDDIELPTEDKRAWGQNKAKVWGKRDASQEEKRKWGQNKAMVWGKRSDEDKRKWGQSKAMVWGKRDGLPIDEEKRKWGQSKAMVWGKRDGLPIDEEKRKWGQSKAMVWGKRDGLPIDEEKRKWGQNKAMVWGKRGGLPNDEEKRKWGQSKAMVWGKRDGLPIDEEKRKWGQNKAMVWGKREALTNDEEKRKWGQNKAKVWGKREDLEDQEKLLSAIDPVIQDLSDEVKRKWGDNKAKVWGKRDTQGEEKRKWGINKSKVWGKRDELEEDKRLWGNNKAKVWGKRDDLEESKRKWGNNKAKVWGKRDEFAEDKRKWGNNKARVWGKRQEQNDDDESSLKPISKTESPALVQSDDRLEEEKRKWAQNKAKVWGKRDVSSVSKNQKWDSNRRNQTTNLSEATSASKLSQSVPQRDPLKQHKLENGTPNLLDKIKAQLTAAKICIRNKTIIPCSEEERNDATNDNKDLPDDVGRSADTKMTSLARPDSSNVAML